MTPRQWKALAARVAERSLVAGSRPSLEARAVLQKLLSYAAAGAEPPSQGELGAALGLEERRLRAALYELGEGGVVALVRRGSRPARYEIDSDRVREWVSGADLWGGFGTASGTDSVPQTAISTYENGATPRARASWSSTSSSSLSSQFYPADSVEAAQLDAMIAAFRQARITVSYLTAKTIASWVGRYDVAEVEAACQAADRYDGRKLGYVETTLVRARMQRETAMRESGVIPLEDFRDQKPWGGAGGAS